MVSRATAARPWSPSSLPRWLALWLARTANSRPRGISIETWTNRIPFFPFDHGNLNLSFLPFLLYRGSGGSTSATRFQPLIDG